MTKTHAHFIRYPELFPGRLAGEPCGALVANIDFSGGPYHVHGLSAGQRAAIDPAFGSMIIDSVAVATGACVDVAVFRSGSFDFLPPVFDRGVYELAFTYETDSVSVSGPSFMGRIQLGETTRAALWTSADTAHEFPIVFENFFRLLVAYRLLEGRGVLLHSAGIVANGEALLMFGPSGAGKSTVARLSQAAGYTVLSDDLNALSLDSGALHVAQVPFAGDLGRVATRCVRVPLRRIFRLKQAKVHGTTPLGKAESIAMLVAAAPFVNSDPHRADTLVGVIADIVTSCRVESLCFAKDVGFMSLISSDSAQGERVDAA
jgi:hypothetical protein